MLCKPHHPHGDFLKGPAFHTAIFENRESRFFIAPSKPSPDAVLLQTPWQRESTAFRATYSRNPFEEFDRPLPGKARSDQHHFWRT
jgi:hypothetical protein